MSGPLAGVKVIEMVGIGPGPFCGMMLADMGADVIRVERPRTGCTGPQAQPIEQDPLRFDVNARGKRTVHIELKAPGGPARVLDLVTRADVLIEGFRPGVMERLGLGPEACLARNPKLVFGRVTGWGQHGPLAKSAGHDLNFIAVSGLLGAMGRPEESPAPPLNLLGGFGGGAMMLAFGIACALLEARQSGKGQVIDAAVSDGSALLGASLYGLKAQGTWTARRGSNLYDGAAPFYDTYECADGKYISLACVEPKFYSRLLVCLDQTDPAFMQQMDKRQWPEFKRQLAALFITRTRAQWSALLGGIDVCFAPVLDMEEAPQHPHNVARNTFIEIDGVTQPAPAPRFSRTVPEVRIAGTSPRTTVGAVLSDWSSQAATAL